MAAVIFIAYGIPEEIALKWESYTGQFFKRYLEPESNIW